MNLHQGLTFCLLVKNRDNGEALWAVTKQFVMCIINMLPFKSPGPSSFIICWIFQISQQLGLVLREKGPTHPPMISWLSWENVSENKQKLLSVSGKSLRASWVSLSGCTAHKWTAQIKKHYWLRWWREAARDGVWQKQSKSIQRSWGENRLTYVWPAWIYDEVPIRAADKEHWFSFEVWIIRNCLFDTWKVSADKSVEEGCHLVSEHISVMSEHGQNVL